MLFLNYMFVVWCVVFVINELKSCHSVIIVCVEFVGTFCYYSLALKKKYCKCQAYVAFCTLQHLKFCTLLCFGKNCTIGCYDFSSFFFLFLLWYYCGQQFVNCHRLMKGDKYHWQNKYLQSCKIYLTASTKLLQLNISNCCNFKPQTK